MEYKTDTKKEEIEVWSYEKKAVDQLLQMLNSLTITGVNQASILCNIVNILSNPSNLKEKEQ